MYKRVVILSSQQGDWEAFYVDGKVIEQSHEIRCMDLLDYSRIHKFDSCDVLSIEAEDKDETIAYETGAFPDHLDKLKGEYLEYRGI